MTKPIHALFVALLGISMFSAHAGEWGQYIGIIVTEWLPDGRKMKIVSDFAYRDPTGHEWTAPAGSIVDGASIPRLGWTVVGGPLEGKYRDASVIHDVACDKRREPWQDVHGAFYTAMRASNVDTIRAKIMYAAVYYFGPRWEQRFKMTEIPLYEVRSRIATFVGDKSREYTVTAEAVNGRVVGGNSNSGPLASIPDKSGGPEEVVDIDIRLVPKPSAIDEGDFKYLRREIESKNLSLEQIRLYHR